MYWAFTHGVCGVNWVAPPPASGFARFLRLGSGRRAGGRLRIALFTRQMWQFFGAPDFVSELVMFTFLGPSGRVHVLRCLTVRKSCSQSKKMLNTFSKGSQTRMCKYSSTFFCPNYEVGWSYPNIVWQDFEENILQIYFLYLVRNLAAQSQTSIKSHFNSFFTLVCLSFIYLNTKVCFHVVFICFVVASFIWCQSSMFWLKWQFSL